VTAPYTCGNPSQDRHVPSKESHFPVNNSLSITSKHGFTNHANVGCLRVAHVNRDKLIHERLRDFRSSARTLAWINRRDKVGKSYAETSQKSTFKPLMSIFENVSKMQVTESSHDIDMRGTNRWVCREFSDMKKATRWVRRESSNDIRAGESETSRSVEPLLSHSIRHSITEKTVKAKSEDETVTWTLNRASVPSAI
jgi:hypothetical protein